MDLTVAVTESNERSPLLQNPSSEITRFTSPSPDGQHEPSPTTNSKSRIISIDVFRGLTVAWMILVDDAGGAFPSINHSPWFGVTLAVMPFFLFSKVSSKPVATKKVVLRTVKLFLLGLILQDC